MSQFRKSVGRLERDKRLAPIFVKLDEKNKEEVKKENSDLPDLSAKCKKLAVADIVSNKD